MASEPPAGAESELESLRRANARLLAELGRRRQEEAAAEIGRAGLQSSERRLRDTLESIDSGFLLLDREFRVIDLNRRAAQMDGRPPARIVGRSACELWPDALGTEAEAVLRRAMHERVPASLLHRYVGGGIDRWLDLRVFPAAQGVTLFFRDVTAQEVDRQRLQEAEASVQLAVAAAGLGTWSWWPQTGRLVWNARHRELFGLDPDAPVDRTVFYGNIHPDDRARVEAAVFAAIKPGSSGTMQEEYRTIDVRDGHERWLAATARAEFQDGRCLRFDGVVADITDRRRAADILADSERRFRAIAEASPGLVFVTDAGGLNTYVNPQFSDYVGRPAETLLDAGWTDIIHPGDLPHTTLQWRTSVESGREYEIEQRFRRHDGAWRRFLCRAVPMRDAAGRIVQWLGTAVDIQDLAEARDILARDRDALERLVAERTAALAATLSRLRSEEARLRAIFEHSSECLFLMRVDPARGLVFLDLNPQALQSLHLPREAVIGRTPQELSTDGSDVPSRDAAMNAALLPGAAPHRYIARRHYGGREQVFDSVAVALDGPEGERLVLVTARDITEQRGLEEALRQSHKMEAVGQLTGGMAHDFNNLLTGISGSLELIRTRAMQGRSNEVDRYVEAALDSVRRGAALTQRLLAFARRQELEPQPLDLNHLVAGMDHLIRGTVGSAVLLQTQLQPDLWPVLCDANQMENALLNLCLNARDAMPDGGTIRIATANEAGLALQGGVSITVSDTGTGMTPEAAARAFEPFFTSKPPGQGTGLGLAMVYGFVRQSGGEVRLSSSLGHGTSVRLELPRCDAGAAEMPVAEPRHLPQADASDRLILLVEDEPMLRDMAAEALQGLGYQVKQAPDAAAALQVLRDGVTVDLLLTDVGLPGMSGRQLAEAARTLRPALKVLFVTGYAHEAGSEVGLIGPGTALLPKPFGLAALAENVRAVLAG